MADSEAARYVAGWAVHWYVDWLGAPGVLDQVGLRATVSSTLSEDLGARRLPGKDDPLQRGLHWLLPLGPAEGLAGQLGAWPGVSRSAASYPFVFIYLWS